MSSAGKTNTIWVKSKPGMYEMKMVTTGNENKSMIEITSGVKEGEVVVSQRRLFCE